MCGCIENMASVARADCQEATPTFKYTLDLQQSSMTLTAVADSFEMEFNACDGYDFHANFTAADISSQEDIDNLVDQDILVANDNDLAAFVYRLHLEGRMNSTTMMAIYDTLVGYEDPNDDNDNDREDSCRNAYEAKFPGRVYPGVDEAEARK